MPSRDVLLLVGRAEDLRGLGRLGPRPIVVAAPLLDAQPAEAERLAVVGAVVVAWPERIPLDLAARIQQHVEGGGGRQNLAGDAIVRARQGLIEDVVLRRYQGPDANRRRARALGIELDRLRAVLVAGFVDFERFYVQDEEEALKLEVRRLRGDIPSPADVPTGCSFHTRCPRRFEPCDRIDPHPIAIDERHSVRCLLYGGAGEASGVERTSDREAGTRSG